MLKINIQIGPMAEVARTTYGRSEFALEYQQQPSAGEPPTLASAIDDNLGIRDRKKFLAIADTLVITFAGENMELVGVDAYTNCDRWLRSSTLALPTSSSAGRVCLSGSFPDDRVDLEVIPEYTYSDEQQLLQISLSKFQESVRFYRVSERLVVGVSGDKLVTLLMQDLSIS
jgi:hypothetical protein